MAKISVIGLGRVGGTLSYELLRHPKVEELFIYDVLEKKTEGLCLDLSHSCPELSNKIKTGYLSQASDSDIIILTAGLPRTDAVKTRMDLAKTNGEILRGVFKSVRPKEDSIVIVVTNPVEPMVNIVLKSTGLDKSKVLGFGGHLDTQRFRCIVAKARKADPADVEGIVIGDHGDNMIPLFSGCTVGGKKANFTNAEKEIIRKELAGMGKKIVDLVGGTQFGPVGGINHLVDSILNDRRRTFLLSTKINDKLYFDERVCMSLPTTVGSNGAIEVKGINLDADEADMMKDAIRNIYNNQKSVAGTE
jgi:malate dehydrogenase